jgi:hypothetical protein
VIGHFHIKSTVQTVHAVTYLIKFGEEILHHLQVAAFFKVYRHGLAFGSQVPSCFSFFSSIKQKYYVKTKK